MQEYSADQLLVMFSFVALIGFFFENTFNAILTGYIDNRCMTLPFIHGYGDMIIGCYLILGIPTRENIVLYFITVFTVICIVEVTVGTLIEKTCHFSWWDYTRIPLHITQYTAVPTSLGFAFVITFFMYRIFNPVMGEIEKLPVHLQNLFSRPLFILISIDTIYNMIIMYHIQGHHNRWRLWIKTPKNTDILLQEKYKRNYFLTSS